MTDVFNMQHTFYGRPEDHTTTYTIEAGTLNHLLKMELICQKLMEAGVHNWEGYDAAMAQVEILEGDDD